jgi:DNA (cytosine-5)-methyltransferase 1
MAKPRLLDLFCGGGGAAMGYARAGFEVVGVDIKPQPNYPFKFILADAIEFLQCDLDLYAPFEVIHASPPCQHYSQATRANGTSENWPDLLPQVREALQDTGLPYIIENVPGAPMRADVKLCGCMFELGVRRLRLFETEPRLFVLTPPHKHNYKAERVYGCESPPWLIEKLKLGVGDLAGKDPKIVKWQRAMKIDWMPERRELAESIPPAYTEFLGNEMLRAIRMAA